MDAKTAAALVDSVCAHMQQHFVDDSPVDEGAIYAAVRALDEWLTGRTGTASIVTRNSIRAYLADPWISHGRIVYLSDGGYSRLVLPGYRVDHIALVGPPSPKVRERWELVMQHTRKAVE